MPAPPTAADIRAQFPEFAKAPDATIDAKIELAVEETVIIEPASKWLLLVKYKTVRLLALTPNGRSMKLVTDEGKTVYDAQIKKLTRANNIGFRVI